MTNELETFMITEGVEERICMHSFIAVYPKYEGKDKIRDPETLLEINIFHYSIDSSVSINLSVNNLYELRRCVNNHINHIKKLKKLIGDNPNIAMEKSGLTMEEFILKHLTLPKTEP